MPLSLPHSPKSRVYGVLGGLAFIALVGCHHRSSVAAKLPAPENVKVGYGEQPRDQIGGAVESATADKLSDVKATQVEKLSEVEDAPPEKESGKFWDTIRKALGQL